MSFFATLLFPFGLQSAATDAELGLCSESSGPIIGSSTGGYELGVAQKFYESAFGDHYWLASTCLGRTYVENVNTYDGSATERLFDFTAEGSSYHLGTQIKFASGLGVKLNLSVAKDKLIARGMTNEDLPEPPIVDEYSRTRAGLYSLISYSTQWDSLINLYLNFGRIDHLYNFEKEKHEHLAQTQFSFGVRFDFDR